VRFGQQIALTYVIRALLIPLGVVNAVIVARWLGPEGKGALAAITAYLAMAGTFGSLGLTTEATRVVATDPSRTAPLLANARLTGTLTGVAALLILLGLFGVLAPSAFDGVSFELLLIAGLALPFSQIAAQFNGVLLGLRRVTAYNAIDAVDRVAFAAASAVLLIGFGLGLKALVIAATLIAVFRMVLLHGLLWPESRRLRPDLALLRAARHVSTRAYVTTLMSFLVLRSDIVLVNGILGSERTGVYSVAVQLAGFVLMLPMAVGTLLFPRVAATKKSDNTAFTALVSRHVALVISAVLVLLFLSGTRLVPLLFGPAFQDAGRALLILLPGVWCVAMQLILANDLAGRDYPRLLPIAWAVSLLVNVTLNLCWIPVYGIDGAAAASTIAYALSFLIVTTYWLRRFPGIGAWRLYFLSGKELRRIPDRLWQVFGASGRAHPE